MKTSENNPKETFLADWIVGKITDDQLKAKVLESDFEAYQKLKISLHSLAIASPDMKQHYASIQQKIAGSEQRKKFKVRPLYAYTAIAASLVLFFGLYHLLAFSNTFQTDYGKTGTHLLSDGSQVTLNANSSIQYPILFAYNRNLKLKGEAYFKVVKGSTFTIATTEGKVQVLGTEFNVNVDQDYFEVHCFEGKVKVCSPTSTHILTHGQTVQVFNQNAETFEGETAQKPTWIAGESTFRNVPIQTVITHFKNQYHYEVEFPKALATVRFTGSFTHRNFDTALQSICLPMHLNYAKIDSNTIRISE